MTPQCTVQLFADDTWHDVATVLQLGPEEQGCLTQTYSGYAIEDLIGRTSFAQMIWLMTRGELPSEGEGQLLDAALMSAVDHGPQAPSIAIARMAATCGVGLNNAMASAVNVLAGIHGGAGQQCMEIYADVARRMDAGEPIGQAVEVALDAWVAENGKVIPGFGHRFHPIDPRSGRLLAHREGANQRLSHDALRLSWRRRVIATLSRAPPRSGMHCGPMTTPRLNGWPGNSVARTTRSLLPG